MVSFDPCHQGIIFQEPSPTGIFSHGTHSGRKFCNDFLSILHAGRAIVVRRYSIFLVKAKEGGRGEEKDSRQDEEKLNQTRRDEEGGGEHNYGMTEERAGRFGLKSESTEE